MAVAFEHESLVGVVGMNIPLGNFGFVTLLRPHFLHDGHKKYEAHQRAFRFIITLRNTVNYEYVVSNT